MSNIEVEIKKWITLIQLGKLEKVTDSIQATDFTNFNEKVNKHIFKLLLYLSHTADKCDKEDHDFGKEIYKLTCSFCSLLTNIPDSNKFVSSVFHIVRCLLTMRMYNEAYEVCSYLKVDKLVYSHESVSDLLVKIAYLWYNAANNVFSVLQNDPNFKHYCKLKDIIKYELELIQIAHKNYTKYLLMKISSYLDKIATLNKESYRYCQDFCTFVIEHLNRTNLILNRDEKCSILRHMLHIMSRMICENFNEQYYEFANKGLNTICKCFKKILIEDEECYDCFQVFDSVHYMFKWKFEYSNEYSGGYIKEICDNYLKITEKYGYVGTIKWTTLGIVQLLESLFAHWEKWKENGEKTIFKSSILLEITNLVEHMSTCFVKQTLEKCKNCQNNECMVKRDIYNAVVIKIRCLNLVCKIPEEDISKDLCNLSLRILEQSVEHIHEMMRHKCKCWSLLWSSCSAIVYNFAIISERHYEESVSFFSLLCTAIVQFEGIQAKSQYIKLKNPVSTILHKLSIRHYNNSMYKEAMSVSALNGLLSYNDADSKAFRMWANIKHKCVYSKEIMDTTMLSYLKENKSKIKELGLSTDLSQYDLVELCLKEVKGLQEAKVNLSSAIQKVLNKMTALNASPVQYARAVQMLAYHLLYFNHDKDISNCVQQAISNLKQTKMSASNLCLLANLEFYIFVSQLQIMSKKTVIEMQNTKFALHAPKLSEIGELESHDVVPAYSMINIKEDSRIMTYLQASLKKWNKCFNYIEQIAKDYESKIILHTLIIAGEYARLYHYQECEINIWELAYKLAHELQDNSIIIYVVGRCISLRNISHNWITTAKELAVKFKDSNDENIIYSIAVFWISLSDFYFESDMYDEAKKLIDKVKELPGISFFSNIAVHLYRLDRILYNCYLYKENIKHEEYTRYIVETLYTMIHLNEELSARTWKPQDQYLFGFDVLLSTTVNLTLRMNSLLSFREIGAHLMRRLKTAQTLGATIRVVEILKSLCYVDLSRSQLSDCEVKLQGLEHILNIETFKASMYQNPVKVISEDFLKTPTRAVDPIRDIPRNDNSPILRNKIFELPDFMSHTTDCVCYACRNVSYRYLVFVSTHIRAQLYALQNNFPMSLQHFHGAFKIKESLMKIEKFTSKGTNEHLSWQERFYSIDYVLLLVNFAYFLRSYLKRGRDKVTNIILLAIQMCDVYKLKGHPIYMSIKELMLDERFQKVFSSCDYSVFTVPDSSDIDISKYIQETKVGDGIYTTPTISKPRIKKPITLRRHQTPPLLKLTKISMNFSDDEDDTSPSPPSGFRRTRSYSRLTRRNILDEEYSEDSSQTKENAEESQNTLFLKEFMNLKGNCFNNVCMKDIINKITSLVPNISDYLYEVMESMNEPVTNENIQKLIMAIENFQPNTASTKKYASRTRNSKQSALSNNTKINEVIAFFKDLDINEQKDNIDLTSKKNLLPELDTADNEKHKPIEQNGKKESSPNNLPLYECNTVDDLKKTCASEISCSRITRNSAKLSVPNNETNKMKTRKSRKKLS